jgi:integrase
LDYLQRIRRRSATVEELAEEVLEAKRKDGHSPIYIADLKKRLARFCATFGERPIAAITVEELYNWSRNLECGPMSRANFRANIGVMFSYAERRRMTDNNPVLRTAQPKLVDKPPEFLSVDELAALLNTAEARITEVLPMPAIGAFAGVRKAELKRLNWSEVDQRRGHIEIRSSKAKSARRRIVEMQPNFREWLRRYAGITGPLSL